MANAQVPAPMIASSALATTKPSIMTETVIKPGPTVAGFEPVHHIVLQTPPMPDTHWTAYATAIATPIVAIAAALIAATIAYRQWKTAHNKLKFDMFEMRFQLYQELIEHMTVWSENWQMQSSLQEFRALQQKAIYLFSDEVNEYLGNILSPKLNEYAANYAQLHGNNPMKDGPALVHRDLELKVWFQDSRKKMQQVFKDDLKLGH
jgi:hypothetical protein